MKGTVASVMTSTFARSSAGHALRLRRILHPKTGRTLIVPLDHAVASGILPGLADTRRILEDAAQGGADAVMIRPGLVDAVVDTDTRALGVILKLSGKLTRGMDHVLLNTVEHAVRSGADAVCAEFKLGSDGDLENVRMVSGVVEAARQYGLPVLMTTYVIGEHAKAVGPRAYAHACRICEELGADIVKTSMPLDRDTIGLCLAAVRIPIVLAGGAGLAGEDVVAQVEAAVAMGIAGAAVGRQIWAADDPISVTRRLRAVIHGRT